MSRPRAVLPNRTYLVTRRVARRHFLLRPDPDGTVQQLYWYFTAVIALQLGIQVHCVQVLSNHMHEVLTDTRGNLPKFFELRNRLLANAVKCHRGWPEEVFSRTAMSCVELLTTESIVDKIAYVITNCVTAFLVRSPRAWPGAKVLVNDIGLRKEIRPRVTRAGEDPTEGDRMPSAGEWRPPPLARPSPPAPVREMREFPAKRGWHEARTAARMSRPRAVLPNRTYLVTRRVARRHFLLRPDPDGTVQQLYWYFTAVIALQLGIQVHCVQVLSNHMHEVLTDTRGNLPKFFELRNRLLANAVKCHRGWPEEVFSPDRNELRGAADDRVDRRQDRLRDHQLRDRLPGSLATSLARREGSRERHRTPSGEGSKARHLSRCRQSAVAGER
ncbi:MAG: hypothetical protein U0263_39310 [Polyangiaceae bacterium]